MASQEEVNRRKLIDRLIGHSADGGLRSLFATTYEFQADFVETDFLPSLLDLGSWDDRSWTSRLALEKNLAEMEAAEVLLDADCYRRRPYSHRLGVHPVHLAPGVKLHAKIVLLVHANAVRLLIGSSNLTLPGYRKNREIVACLRATSTSPAAALLIRDAVREAKDFLAPWLVEGARLCLDRALTKIDGWRPTDDTPANTFAVWSGPDRPLWRAFLGRWPAGKPIRRITIVSPFWSEEPANGPLSSFVERLSDRAPLEPRAELRLLTEARQVAADRFIPVLSDSLASLDTGPLGVLGTAQAVDPAPAAGEYESQGVLAARTLHAKCVLIDGERHALAYVGSANFTRAGWGIGSDDGQRSNVEAGLIMLRAGKARAELSSLIPAVCGAPVPLDGTARARIAVLADIAPPDPWPDFLRDVLLVVKPGESDRLQLALMIDQAAVSGEWRVSSLSATASGEHQVFWRGEGTPSSPELRIDIDGSTLERLLRDREVLVIWDGCPTGRPFPINVSLEARDALPPAPGAGQPGEALIVAYYQGKIPWEGVFPPPEGESTDDDPAARAAARTQVDTSGIQAYQIREFVEALHGIRKDLRDAAQTPGAMRLALVGPVSPVALARSICQAASAKQRSPLAAGFQLTELLCCLREARTFAPPDHQEEWRGHLRKAENDLLELTHALEGVIGDLTAIPTFQRYKDAICGYYDRPGVPQ